MLKLTETLFRTSRARALLVTPEQVFWKVHSIWLRSAKVCARSTQFLPLFQLGLDLSRGQTSSVDPLYLAQREDLRPVKVFAQGSIRQYGNIHLAILLIHSLAVLEGSLCLKLWGTQQVSGLPASSVAESNS